MKNFDYDIGRDNWTVGIMLEPCCSEVEHRFERRVRKVFLAIQQARLDRVERWLLEAGIPAERNKLQRPGRDPGEDEAGTVELTVRARKAS